VVNKVFADNSFTFDVININFIPRQIPHIFASRIISFEATFLKLDSKRRKCVMAEGLIGGPKFVCGI
jgi:hypothetical protein